MDTKSMLLAVADPQALVDINQALGQGWKTTSVASEAEALAQLEKRSFDALLADFNLGSSDASELLNQALKKRPELPRFLFATEADLALVAALVNGPHEILPKPLEPASIRSRIESGLAQGKTETTQDRSKTSAVTAPAAPVPAVYNEVLAALDLPNATSKQVGKAIAKDAALKAEVLRLTNSAYLGLPRNVNSPTEAVELLGLDTIRALVMALRFLAEHSQLKTGYLSLEKLWQHSTKVAQLARDLVLFETKDRKLAAEALVGGLLHDLGKVVLASNFDDLYGRVHSLARKQPVPLWDIEKEMFGASHGEIGACLVGMWNLPGAAVQAAAFHHEPPLGENETLTPLAAVHIANVLEHELRPNEELRVAPVMNTAFLSEIGLLQRLPVWRAVFVNPHGSAAKASTEPAEEHVTGVRIPVLATTPSPRTANLLPAETAPTQTATSGHSAAENTQPAALAFRHRRWFYAGAAAAVLGLLLLWQEMRQDDPVRALTPPAQPAAEAIVAAPTPAPDPDPETVPDPTPAMATPAEDPATIASTASGPASAAQAPESAVTAAPLARIAAADAPTAPPAPVVKEKPDFRLNGIIYTVDRPAAMLNGRTVYVGDRVNGGTVASIGRTQVTLLIDGVRKTFVLE